METIDVAKAVAQVTVYVGFSAFVVKGLVDAFKATVDPPRWVSPLAAIGGGVLVVALVMLVQGLAFTPSLIATAVLAGMLSGMAAIGATKLQEQERGGPREQVSELREQVDALVGPGGARPDQERR